MCEALCASLKRQAKDLLAGLSPALRKRMQGKSCFNFREADPALMRELESLTKAGIARVKQDGAALLAT